jgi:hypothetical protein
MWLQRVNVAANDKDGKSKSKAQEAAEERALARLGQIESTYQRRDNDANETTGNVSSSGATANITVTDTDQQLPKYVP